MRLSNKLINKEKNLYIWNDFFEKYTKKTDRILDFGCGAGWSIYLGLKLGYDIRGIDVDSPPYNMEEMVNFREEIETARFIDIYDGNNNLPYEDESYDIIVCKASLEKFNDRQNNEALKNKREDIRDELVDKRCKEFSRILRGKKTLVAAGGLNPFNKKFLSLHGINFIRWRFRELLKDHPEYFSEKRLMREGVLNK